MKGKDFTIGLIVMESICGQATRNLEKICAYIEQAGQSGARLAVFPELALTGYCLAHTEETALPLDHHYVDALRKSAKEAGVTALVGVAEQTEDTYYISQLVCGCDGSLGVYRKTHLGSREEKVFSAGNRLPVFESGMPFGVAVCYDMHFPEVAATMKAGGADLIVAPHATPVQAGSREEIWAKYMSARAYDNRVYVACCNACGNNGCGTSFSGGIAVYAPDGTMVESDFSGAETMLTVELPLMRFEDGKDFPAHRRPELYL